MIIRKTAIHFPDYKEKQYLKFMKMKLDQRKLADDNILQQRQEENKKEEWKIGGEESFDYSFLVIPFTIVALLIFCFAIGCLITMNWYDLHLEEIYAQRHSVAAAVNGMGLGL